MSSSSIIENLKFRKAVAEAAAAGAILYPAEAAAYVNKSRGYLAIMRCKGRGPEFKLSGTRVYYTKEWLDAWLSSCVTRKTVAVNVGRPRSKKRSAS